MTRKTYRSVDVSQVQAKTAPSTYDLSHSPLSPFQPGEKVVLFLSRPDDISLSCWTASSTWRRGLGDDPLTIKKVLKLSNTEFGPFYVELEEREGNLYSLRFFKRKGK